MEYDFMTREGREAVRDAVDVREWEWDDSDWLCERLSEALDALDRKDAQFGACKFGLGARVKSSKYLGCAGTIVGITVLRNDPPVYSVELDPMATLLYPEGHRRLTHIPEEHLSPETEGGQS